MRLTIASGKGGTGKTTVAICLALALAAEGSEDVAYADCDVEAPNGHIFLKPEISEEAPVHVLRPEIDSKLCTGCGACGEICQFSAILCLGDTAQTFDRLCHGCGGCVRVCPTGAIRERSLPLGIIRKGHSGSIRFLEGRIEVGEAMATPIIRELKRQVPETGAVILDAPPGTACPVIETLRDSDYVLLVADDTPFSLHDLELSVEVLRVLKLPFGIIVNRSNGKDERIRRFAKSEGITIYLTIPDDRRIAVAYSVGKSPLDVIPALSDRLRDLYDKVKELVSP